MKLQILPLFAFLFAFTLTEAQQPKVFTIPEDSFKDTALLNKLKDKDFVDSLKNELRKRYAPYNKLQLAGSMPRRLNYIGNNQQGFDIYQTPYDNMYILKPDSTFASNMPVANTYNLTMRPVEMPNPKKDRRE